jgi:tripartite-type tricarboxylate transporter receptor subunit TctC
LRPTPEEEEAVTKYLKLLTASLVLASLAPLASAQGQYPNKPIRMVLQFPAGGLADAIGRVLAPPLAQQLGQPIIVDNRPGADGAIAGDIVVKSPPDGYTIFFATTGAIASIQGLRKNPPYDSLVDFTPISMIGRFPFFVFAHPSLPAKNLAELIDYARANPGKLNYGSGNNTSIVATAQIALLAKVQMHHIPYKGDPPLMLDLVSGRLHFALASTSPGGPLAKEGKLRVLGTLGSSRNALFPDAPTMAESGFPQFKLVSWIAMFGPAKLPADIVERLAHEFNTAIKRPEVKGALDKYAFELEGSTPQELTAYVREQVAYWKRSVREAGITPD